jgi:hypothetical protein
MPKRLRRQQDDLLSAIHEDIKKMRRGEPVRTDDTELANHASPPGAARVDHLMAPNSDDTELANHASPPGAARVDHLMAPNSDDTELANQSPEATDRSPESEPDSAARASAHGPDCELSQHPFEVSEQAQNAHNHSLEVRQQPMEDAGEFVFFRSNNRVCSRFRGRGTRKNTTSRAEGGRATFRGVRAGWKYTYPHIRGVSAGS